MFGSLAEKGFLCASPQAVWLKNRDLFRKKQRKEEKGLVGLRAGGYSLWRLRRKTTGHTAIHSQAVRKMNTLATLTFYFLCDLGPKSLNGAAVRI